MASDDDLRAKLYAAAIAGCTFNPYGECETHPTARNYNPRGNDEPICAEGYDVVKLLLPVVGEALAAAWDEGYAMATDDFVHSDYCGRVCQCEGISGGTNPWRDQP